MCWLNLSSIFWHMATTRDGWEGPLLVEGEESDPSRISLRNPKAPGWMVTVTFGPLGEVVGFSVDAHEWRAERRHPLDTALIQGLGAGGAIAKARVIASATARAQVRRARIDPGQPDLAPLPASGPVSDLSHWSALVSERTGMRGKGDEVYAKVAAAYVAAVDSGERAPLRMVAEAFHVSEGRARNIVHEARKRGLLTATKAGKKGGRMTAKGRSVLKRAGQTEGAKD